MLTLLTSEQIRLADAHTIAHKPIPSIDLMERAALAFCESFIRNFPDKSHAIAVYCGTGNNGGDGLAIARLLSQNGYRVDVKICRFSGSSSADFDGNLARLMAVGVRFDEFRKMSELTDEPAVLIIDALLGTGLNKPLNGGWLALVEWLNSLGKPIVSVDIPTGFKAEGPISKHDVTIKSTLTITFQRPKINFLLPESAFCIDRFEVVDIGLDEQFVQATESSYQLLTEHDVRSRLKRRSTFSHKGTFGHTLIIAGATETMGAALLCTEASVYCGSGLTTACVPQQGLSALNIKIPEAMAIPRNGDLFPEIIWNKYDSVAIGPGLGVSEKSKATLETLFREFRRPAVIDADAINLLAAHTELFPLVPKGSILTPHVKEFDRLFGEHQSWWERLQTGQQQAKKLELVIVLKNRFTIIFTPGGNCIFNPSGTPAMATGGMGDVLTGMIASFMAQAYKPEDAALLGVFLHGRAGNDIVEMTKSYVVTPSELLRQVPQTIGKIV